MCWISNNRNKIILTQPLIVYKVGVLAYSNPSKQPSFCSAVYSYYYNTKGKCEPELSLVIKTVSDMLYIDEGYHSFFSIKDAMAELEEWKWSGRSNMDICRFLIPKGATIYMNKKDGTIVSNIIKFLDKYKTYEI